MYCISVHQVTIVGWNPHEKPIIPMPLTRLLCLSVLKIIWAWTSSMQELYLGTETVSLTPYERILLFLEQIAPPWRHRRCASRDSTNQNTLFLEWKWRLERLGARSIRPKIPIWLSEIFICRMERYFPLRRTDLIPFPLDHILLDKMLKDHGKVTVLSAVSCFIENLTHTGNQNSPLIFTWPTQTPFSHDKSNLQTFLVGKYAREVCKQRRTKPQEIRNDKSTIFQKIRS